MRTVNASSKWMWWTTTSAWASVLLFLMTAALDGCDSNSAEAGAGGSGGAGTGGLDCSQIMMGPPMGAGGGMMGQMPDFACITDNCGDPCKDLIDSLPMGPPAGSGGSGGGVPDLPGADLYVGRSCNSCHGDQGQGSGGPNITPSMMGGIGDWSADEVKAAIRTGVGKDGNMLCASMPRWNEGQIAEADLDTLVGFLAALPPIDFPNPGTLCTGGTTSSGSGMMGGPMIDISDECLSCLDQSCPEIGAIFQCFAGN